MTEQEIEIIVNKVLEKINGKVDLPIELIDDTLLPFYAHPTDAGLDIRARTDAIIHPAETVIIPSGIKLAIPEGYEIQIRPRSGINAKTPLRVALGTIDTGYRGELGIVMTNYSPVGSTEMCTIEDKHKHGIYQIRKGDRIAQIVFNKITTANLVQCKSVADFASDRGLDSGFGSSGVK